MTNIDLEMVHIMRKATQSALLLMIFSLVFLAAPAAGYACTCAPMPTVQEQYRDAGAVFAGKVINIKTDGKLSTVSFQVTSAWKGVTTNQITIKTPSELTACGYPFQIGKSYLVYTTANLTSNICMRTNELSKAQEDLSILGQEDR